MIYDNNKKEVHMIIKGKIKHMLKMKDYVIKIKMKSLKNLYVYFNYLMPILKDKINKNKFKI